MQTENSIIALPYSKAQLALLTRAMLEITLSVRTCPILNQSNARDGLKDRRTDGFQHSLRAPWQGRTTSRELNDSTFRSRAIRSCRCYMVCWRRSFADNIQPAVGKLGLRTTGNLAIRSSRCLILLL